MTAAPLFQVTLPSGVVNLFASVAAFEGYVKFWRESGYPVSWSGPRVAVISRPASVPMDESDVAM